jgi:ligand-binding sensor domain-containing protein/signal transduction histidine kinase
MLRKTIIRGLVSFEILLASCVPVFASSSWFARTWQSEDGLPDNSVSGLAQTKDGYLWVATMGGLARFDGVQFQQFSPFLLSHGSNRMISAMMLDHQDRLWIEMARGAVASIGSKNAHVFSGGDLPDAQALGIVQDAEESIWLSYGNGTVVRIKDDQVNRIGIKQGLPPDGAASLTTDVQRQLWFVKNGTLGTFRQERFQTLATLPFPSAQITGARSGGVWAVSGAKIFKFIEGQSLQEVARLPLGATATALLEDRAGNLWIGTVRHGLFRYDGHVLESAPTSNNTVSCISQDYEGNIWAGTLGGLDRLRPRMIELAGAATGLPIEPIRSVTEDKDGSLWIATLDGSLAHGQRDGWKILSRQKNWPGGEVMTAAADPSGGVWIGTHNQGLLHFQQDRFKIWRTENGLASNTVRSLLVTSTGDLWLGTDLPYKLQRLRNDSWRTFDIPQSARLIRAMAEDPSGDVWVGTAGGKLFRAHGDTVIDESDRVGVRQSIRSLCVTRDGNLWIGYSADGLGWWNGNKLMRLFIARGLWDNSISQIVADQQGRLWFAANRGIFYVQENEAKAVAEGSANRVHSVIFFGKAEGLPSLEGSYDGVPGALLDHDGHIWMATRSGLAMVHAENIPGNTAPPPVVVERVLVDEQPIALDNNEFPLLDKMRRSLPPTGSDLVVPKNYHKIEFKFTALSFTAPENVRFRYRLEGFDDDWVEAGTARSVSYPRLNPGRYRFHVLACNGAGVWNETGAVLNLSAPLFYWQTGWFRAVSLTALIILITAAVRYLSWRRLRLRLSEMKQESALNSERARIAHDLHDDLGAQLTQVTLLLELASENGMARNHHVAEGLETIRGAIQSLDETVWAVNPRNNTLPELISYIGQFAMEFLRRAKILCNLQLPEEVPDHPVSFELRHHLFLLVKEALNNVVRHARAREVQVRITTDATAFTLFLEDDGCGFITPTKEMQADGLHNMQYRAKEIGAELQVESRLGAGTCIMVRYRWPRLQGTEIVQSSPDVN